ncbi:hypothetical protein F2Q68_00009770 [Brassica cretica]|uniref:Uncharacterized protein n=1 Tax=Brassica cretica TaxID=69181 RepID=A0A3N6QWD7_BRACR|nr:hypothetical protein F2Q68_00009770 [Brassica cretica]
MKEPSNEDIRLESKSNPTGHTAIRGANEQDQVKETSDPGQPSMISGTTTQPSEADNYRVLLLEEVTIRLRGWWFSWSEVFHFLEESRVQGSSPGFPLVGTRGTHLSGIRGSESCLEAEGKNTRIVFPNTGLPLNAPFRHRTRGVTCALKSTGVAHSQQASLKQDITPVILRSRVPLKPEQHSEPGGGPSSLIPD